MKIILSPLLCFGSIALANGSGSKDGRFQIVQISEFRQDQFLIDSQTGRLWRAVCAAPGDGLNQCRYTIWEPQDIIGITTSGAQADKQAARIKANADKSWMTDPPTAEELKAVGGGKAQ